MRKIEAHALCIHPSDAVAKRADGVVVHVYSPYGSMRVKTAVTDEIMSGAVGLLEGAWSEFDTRGVEIAGSVSTDQTEHEFSNAYGFSFSWLQTQTVRRAPPDCDSIH